MEDDDKDLDLNATPEIPTDTTRIDISETDDGDEGEQGTRAEDEIPAAGERQRDDKGKWKKNKGERGQSKREQTNWQKERETLMAEIRREREANTTALAEMRGRLEQMGRPAPGAQNQDPIASEITQINQSLNQELQRAGSVKDYPLDRYWALQDRKAELIAMRVAQRQIASQPKQQQNPYASREPYIEAEFPWTMDPRNAGLNKKAWAIRRTLIEVEGRPDTIETDREALKTAVARFGAEYGLRAPAAPGPRSRAAWAAPSFSDRGAPRGDDGGDEVDIPNELLRGSGLQAQTLRRLAREAVLEANGRRR